MCAVDSDIYVIGEQTHDDDPCAETYKYNVVNNVWSLVSPMPSARAGHQACLLAGYDADFEYLNSMLRYDPASDTWNEVAPMSQDRYNFSMFVADNCIYAVGGYSDDEDGSDIFLASLEK